MRLLRTKIYLEKKKYLFIHQEWGGIIDPG